MQSKMEQSSRLSGKGLQGSHCESCAMRLQNGCSSLIGSSVLISTRGLRKCTRQDRKCRVHSGPTMGCDKGQGTKDV